MKPLLFIQPTARQELKDAAAWYSNRDVRVAERFVQEVERTLGLIERFPGTGAQIPLVTGNPRRLPVNGFPYHVIFEEFDDRVEVLAIAHDRRRPGYWRA